MTAHSPAPQRDPIAGHDPADSGAGTGSGLLTAVALARHVERCTTRRDRLPGMLAVLAFAVATAALLVTLAGLHAFSERNPHAQAGSTGYLYLSLAFAASGLLVAPILTLGGVAARLTLGRRDQRLATMRLVGATRSQVGAMTLAETGRLALRGAGCGVVLYAVLVPALSPLRFQGRPFHPTELVVPWWWVPVVVLAVVLLALASGLASLRRVAVSPLGVVARHTPRRLSLARLGVTAAVLVVWLVVGQHLGRLATAVLMVILAGAVAVMNAMGPFVMMLLGHLTARFARRPRTLIAARRVVDDPRGAWRSVGSLGLGITIAGLAGTAAAVGHGGDAQNAQLLADMRTGAFVTLAIISVIAATSTGVVQATRIIDRGEELRMLALAGAEIEDLAVAARREVTLPLGATVAMACGFCTLILAPAAVAVGPATMLWLMLAIVGSCGLVLVALRSTVPLISRAAAGHDEGRARRRGD